MKRKSSFLIFLIFFCGAFLFGKSPSIFVDGTLIDLGYIKPHTETPFKFTIYNSGDALLVIKSIVHTCGCTKLEYDKKVVPPDGKMVVKGELKTYGERGPIIKYIYITSNSPGREKVEVRVKAYVRAEVEATPPHVEILFPLKDIFKKEILINYYGKGKFKISKVLDEKDFFKFELNRRRDDAFDLHITLIKKNFTGKNYDTISVYSNSKDIPILRIPVYFSKRETFSIFPGYLKLGVIREDKPIIKRVILRSKEKGKNILLRSIVKKDWFDYEILKNNSKMVIVKLKIYPEKFNKLQDTINFNTNLGNRSLNVALTYVKHEKGKKK